MNSNQREYFKQKLLQWKAELAIEDKKDAPINPDQEADMLDIATQETARNIKIMTKRREQMLLFKIDQALKKIEEGTYGYCEETGEPIDLRRLIARPIATLSIEAQERQEKLQKYSKSNIF